jgi:hypothetical protein
LQSGLGRTHVIKVKYKPQSYFTGGHVTTIFANKLEIILNENSKTEEKFTTLIHELGHLFLGHTGHKELSSTQGGRKVKLLHRKISRTAEELEAETVSYLLSKKLGLKTSAAEYIAGYITCDDDLINFSYEMVIKTADKIEELFLNHQLKNSKPIQQSLF